MILHACTAGETRRASDLSWLSDSYYTIMLKSAADSLLYAEKEQEISCNASNVHKSQKKYGMQNLLQIFCIILRRREILAYILILNAYVILNIIKM